MKKKKRGGGRDLKMFRVPVDDFSFYHTIPTLIVPKENI